MKNLSFIVVCLGLCHFTSYAEISDIIVAEIQKSEKMQINVAVLEENFTDGVKIFSNQISYDKNLEQYFLVQRGNDAVTGDCELRRTSLMRFDAQFKPGPMGQTETCKGIGCSHCDFKAEGGCECSNSYNLCEHSISRSEEVFTP